MKQLLVFQLLLLSLISSCYTQNLLPDPGFENLKVTLETNNLYRYNYTEWHSIVPQNRFSSFGLPSYSNFLRITDNTTSDTITEKYITRLSGLNKPHRGDSYFTPADYTTRTMNEAKLVAPLQKDSVYYFQMYIKITANKFSKEDLMKGKIGLWFCRREYADTVGMGIMQKNKLKISPHIQVKDFNTADFEHWVKFSARFKSDQEYNYVIIGNVEPMEKLEMEMKDKWQGISYRIDDVCLVPYSLKATCGLLDKEEVYELQNIYFDVNSFQLSQDSKKELQNLAQFYKKRDAKMTLHGHTDNTGNELNNNELSQNRAGAVYNYLLGLGIDASRMSVQGEGSAKPIENNSSTQGRKMNRRVEIKLEEE